MPGRTQAQVFAAFDLERVEILKGPQGTLFGRNATGGLVHFISRKPTEEFEAFGEAQYGEENQVRFEGAVSGPLTDNVQVRVSGLYNRHDDIMNNVYNGISGDPLGDPPGLNHRKAKQVATSGTMTSSRSAAR